MGGVAVTDLDEWLRPGADHDEVGFEVDDVPADLVLRATLLVTPVMRRVELCIALAGRTVRHDAEEAGPPASNWDRMRIGGVEWRMVEPLRRWELAADDDEAALRVYLSFSGAGPCTPLADGYEQIGTVSGQVQLAGQRVTVTDAPARRSHRWRLTA